MIDDDHDRVMEGQIWSDVREREIEHRRQAQEAYVAPEEGVTAGDGRGQAQDRVSLLCVFLFSFITRFGVDSSSTRPSHIGTRSIKGRVIPELAKK